MFLWMKCSMSAGRTLTCTCTAVTWPPGAPLTLSLPDPVFFSFPPHPFTFLVFLCAFISLVYFRYQRCFWLRVSPTRPPSLSPTLGCKKTASDPHKSAGMVNIFLVECSALCCSEEHTGNWVDQFCSYCF